MRPRSEGIRGERALLNVSGQVLSGSLGDILDVVLLSLLAMVMLHYDTRNTFGHPTDSEKNGAHLWRRV